MSLGWLCEDGRFIVPQKGTGALSNYQLNECGDKRGTEITNQMSGEYVGASHPLKLVNDIANNCNGFKAL